MPLPNLTSWLPLAFLAFGLLFTGLGISTVRKNRRRREEWLTVPGRVVGSRLSGDGQVQCQVAYRRDGQEVLFWNRFTSSTMSNPVGRAVEVLVNPDDPGDAVVSAGLVSGGLVGWAFLVFGLVVVVVGVVVGAVLLLLR